MTAGTDRATDEYVAFCEGVRRLARLDLLQYRRGQMERRIRSFAQRRGIEHLGEYLRILEDEAGALDDFLDRVTINVSQLWRNPEQWRMLGREILPELAERGRIRAWSAGCSYGAEAYTLAAVCHETVPACPIEIVGTDIDPRVIARARAGWFSHDDARDADRPALARWFGPSNGGWQASDRLMQAVRFQVGDLLDLAIPERAYDLVLCRNVVIYLNQDVRDGLHRRLAASLRCGGYLLVGSTERVSAPGELGLSSTRPFVYRKV